MITWVPTTKPPATAHYYRQRLLKVTETNRKHGRQFMGYITKLLMDALFPVASPGEKVLILSDGHGHFAIKAWTPDTPEVTTITSARTVTRYIRQKSPAGIFTCTGSGVIPGSYFAKDIPDTPGTYLLVPVYLTPNAEYPIPHPQDSQKGETCQKPSETNS